MLLFRDAGADVNAIDRYGRTPLHVAAHHGNLQAAYALIKAGADVEARDRNGVTALMHAISGEDPLALVDALIRKGADIAARDAQGRTALMRVEQAGRNDLTELLVSHGASRYVGGSSIPDRER